MLAVVLGDVVHWWNTAWTTYLAHPLHGNGYQWWSGLGSDLGEASILAAIGATYVHHTCHVDGCWWPGRHPVDGTGYKACRKHHPAIDHTVRLTAEHIAHAFHLHRSNAHAHSDRSAHGDPRPPVGPPSVPPVAR